MEYGLTPNWTIKGEALYADVGPATSTFVVPPPGTGPGTRFAAGLIYGARFDTSVAVIRAGLNYSSTCLHPQAWSPQNTDAASPPVKPRRSARLVSTGAAPL